MRKNYTDLVEKVKRRSNPDLLRETKYASESINENLRNLGTTNREILEYIKRAMVGVESEYTDKTIEAGNKIKQHLKNNNPNLDYRFQGSVMCNTHIKGYSDIDLIQITNSFYSHEPRNNFSQKHSNSNNYLTPTQNQNLLNIINGTPYNENPNTDLRKLRLQAETVLTGIYKNVIISKPKSIEVNPTYPNRIVDVVTASWYKNIESELANDPDLRGINIYDKEKNECLPKDYPFVKIRLLNERDKTVNGRLKKMIRFLKTIKADSDYNLKGISSFDISSICYNISIWKYLDKSYYELVLVIYSELKIIVEDETYRNTIKSIDGTEYIFKNNNEKVRLLKLIFEEISFINQDLVASNSMINFF